MSIIPSPALGLAAALAWGVADFGGGLASRRSRLFDVLVVSQGAGVLSLVFFALAFSERVPALPSVLWGIAVGLAASVGCAALYQALSMGKMGVASPITAVLVASVPFLFGVLTQGPPGLVQFAGLGLGLVALWLVSGKDSSGTGSRNIKPALIAGLGFGIFLILLSQAGTGAVFWTLSTARSVSFLLILGIAVSRGQISLPPSRLLPLSIVAGVLDVTGSAFFMLAAGAGRLDVAAVLSSLYPLATVVLARSVLREHLTRAQTAGITVALVAVSLIIMT